jgi:arabinogalactan endo-1,4-beta-galactosidase
MKKVIFSGLIPIAILVFVGLSTSCNKEEILGKTKFVFGADLSYVNQILEHGGVYKDNGVIKDPYQIFSDRGTNLVRLRLWHNPAWTKTVYGKDGTRMYNDLEDVREAIRRSKAAGMAVNLDIHYSDTWADPQHQIMPEAWKGLSYSVLRDSVYQYTFRVLQSLNSDGLMPEMVQIGNEINPGMLLPVGSYMDHGWAQLGGLINSGIKAVRDVSKESDVKTLIILHVAQPENVEFWFRGVTTLGEVNDFDIIGLSYYSKWSDIQLAQLSGYIRDFRETFGKTVMVVETAYPWTGDGADSYGNIFGANDAEPGYPLTPEGQYKYMVALTQAIKDGGGMGIMVWEPAWITSQAKDLWGTGSAWENCTFFDFEGNVNRGMDFMTNTFR